MVGRPGRIEDPRLLRGEAAYTADVSMPGLLAAMIVRSDVAHGRIRSIDTTAARAVPGVHAVLTATDLVADGFATVPEIPIRRAGRPGMELRLQPLIAHDRVRYVGEPIAIIVADDRYIAEDAAELIETDIEPLDPIVDVSVTSPWLWDEHDNTLFTLRGHEGDADAVFADAPVIVKQRFTTGRQTGLPLETRSLVARWDGDRKLELWGPTKFVVFTRDTAAMMLGIDPQDVTVHRVDVGGMFGPRGEFYPEDFLVPWAARVVGQPVKWVEDRREHLLAMNHSREQVNVAEMALDRDGRFLAMRVDTLIDMGAYPRPIGGRLGELVIENLPGPYLWDAFDIRVEGRASNKTPVGTMRGPSVFEANFVRERLIDLAAVELGMDRLEIRRRNIVPVGSIPYFRDFGGDIEHLVYDSGDCLKVLDALLADMDFEDQQATVAARRAAGERVGLGVALFAETSGIGRSESASLRIDPTGRFVISSSGSEIGQGLGTTLIAIVAEELGIDPENIDFELGSSEAPGGGNGTYGSRSTIFVGSALINASHTLMDDAAALAAKRLEVDVSALERTADGFRGPDESGGSVLWSELAPLEVIGTHEAEAPTWGFGANVAQVRVDTGTGAIVVERLGVAYDCGRAIRPEGVVGQLVGAAVQGIGGAILEELRYDPGGQPLSTSFMDYLLPTCLEAPRIEAVVVQSGPVPGNPLGIKGAGEAGIVGVGAAIANAVADAVGGAAGQTPVALSLPISPETLVEQPARPVKPERPEKPVLPVSMSAGPPASRLGATEPDGLSRRARLVAALSVAGALALLVLLWRRTRR